MKSLLCLLVPTFLCCGLPLEAYEDGIYLLKNGPEKSPLRYIGGTPCSIDRKLAANEYTLEVVSMNNRNDRFMVDLETKDKLGPPNRSQLAIAADGMLYAVVGTLDDSLQSLEPHSIARPVDGALAARIAEIGGVLPVARKHLGQILDLRISVDKGAYREKEAVVVSVQVKNLGQAQVVVRLEYPNGRTRSSLLMIIPREQSVRNCTDMRLRTGYGSVIGQGTIAPGETATLREELLQYSYRLKKPDTYFFLGTYQLNVYEKEGDKYPSWVEYLGDEFRFRYGE